MWVTTAGGAQQVNYSYGLHPEYGARFGATILDGDGIFNEEFKGLVQRYGVPRPLDDERADQVRRLRRTLRGDRGGRDEGKVAEARARVESYILSELGRGVTEMRGAGAGDAKALRLARNLLSVFKPKLIGVVLQDADIAHGSFNGYSEVVRRADAGIEAARDDPGGRDAA